MAKYQFGNFEVEFDPTNVEFVKKYEIAAENYKNKVQNMPSNKKASETMENTFAAYFSRRLMQFLAQIQASKCLEKC